MKSFNLFRKSEKFHLNLTKKRYKKILKSESFQSDLHNARIPMKNIDMRSFVNSKTRRIFGI
jgi:hypothetical protein